MDYEKKYNEALEKARQLCTYPTSKPFISDLQNLFPELKESDDGETKKSLMQYIWNIYHREYCPPTPSIETCDKWLAWLEKQGEQETDKWKEGNIIRHGGVLALVIKGRRAMKSNGEIFTVQYPDEWVKAAPNEIEHFLNELEKQGKKPQGKTALEAINDEKVDNDNKVEPKFKVGDWIIENGVNRNPVQITSFEEDKGVGIKVWFSNGTGTYIDFLKGYHKWTIQDAKDGDVLFHSDSASNGIFIFKELLKCGFSEKVICYCDYDSEDGFCLGEHHTCCWADAKILHPATKEQRDLLFQKMKEKSYEWDEEKKEPKKIVAPKFNIHDCVVKKHNSNINDFGYFIITDITDGKYWYNDRIICDITEQDEWEIYEPIRQNSTWDEEDEHTLQGIIDEIQANKSQAPDYDFETYDRFLFWLKTLKYRIGG